MVKLGVWLVVLLALLSQANTEENSHPVVHPSEPANEDDQKLEDPHLAKLKDSIERSVCLEVFGRINRKELQEQQTTLSDFIPEGKDIEEVRLKFLANALAECVKTLQATPKKEVIAVAESLLDRKQHMVYTLATLPKFFQFNENIFHKGLTEQTELEDEMLLTVIAAQRAMRENLEKNGGENGVPLDKNGLPDDLESLKVTHQRLYDYISTANEKIKWDSTWYSLGGVLLGFMLGGSFAGIQHWRNSRASRRGTGSESTTKSEASSDPSNISPADLEKRWAALKKQKDQIVELRAKISVATRAKQTKVKEE